MGVHAGVGVADSDCVDCCEVGGEAGEDVAKVMAYIN